MDNPPNRLSLSDILTDEFTEEPPNLLWSGDRGKRVVVVNSITGPFEGKIENYDNGLKVARINTGKETRSIGYGFLRVEK